MIRHKSKTWCIVFSIDDADLYGRYGVMYKSPKEKINDFLEILDDIFEDALNPLTRNIIFGDMNINTARKAKNVKKYLSVLSNHNVEQCVNQPTRVNKKSATIIDHILTNVSDLNWCVNVESPSDHFKLEITIKNKKAQIVDRRKIKYTCWKNYSKEKLSEMLSLISWSDCDDVNSKCTDLTSNLKKILSQLIVKREKPYRHAKNRWYTPAIGCMKKLIRNARDKYECTKNDDDAKEINRLMKNYKDAINNAKAQHIKESLEKNFKNSKKLWKIIKSLYSDKSSEIKNLNYGDEEINDAKENAQRLNSHIVSSVEKIIKEIPSAIVNDFNEKIPVVNELFELKEIEMKDLLRIVKDLKEKSYDDNITGQVLSDAMNVPSFANQLLAIVNDSILQSVMPSELRSSTVTPIPKVPSPKCPDDLRPINNLPVIEKLIETVVHEQLSSFIDANGILCDEQSGFRKGHSTETSILAVLHDLFAAKHKKLSTIAVFLDLKRAFETVSRDVLIDKLKKYNFDEKTIKWFMSFLCERKQRVKVNGEYSSETEINYGLPQGSKLANLLFILFINDLPLSLKKSKINMFADDCMIYVSCDSNEEAVQLINEDLMTIHDWLCFNKMALNVKKCSSMAFGKNRNDSGDVKIKDCIIKRESSVKYLGVYIDENLNFECHYEKVAAKLNKRLSLLRRISHKMTTDSKITYFKSIILPITDYCSSILLQLTDSNLKCLQRILNKALRVVLHLPRDSNVDEMHKRLKILKLNQRINFNAIKIINKTMTKGTPHTFRTKFKRRSENREKTLRSDNDIDVMPWKNKNSQRSIFVQSVKNMNDLMTNQFDEKMTFLANVKNYVITKF
jgi:hypothetical protein